MEISTTIKIYQIKFILGEIMFCFTLKECIKLLQKQKELYVKFMVVYMLSFNRFKDNELYCEITDSTDDDLQTVFNFRYSVQLIHVLALCNYIEINQRSIFKVVKRNGFHMNCIGIGICIHM